MSQLISLVTPSKINGFYCRVQCTLLDVKVNGTCDDIRPSAHFTHLT